MSERESPQALPVDDSTTSAAAAATTTVDADDTFELFDLRVEVVCPPGARILCGAKPGDHFVLRGEMLHLPPGQGFSIYSLGAWRIVWCCASLLLLSAWLGGSIF